MPAFDALVLAEVRRRGRVTFAEFMEWSLYHPHHGYYTGGASRTGRGRDFLTNVQTGGLFGKLLAESFCDMWDRLGSKRFTMVELGASDGALAEQVLKSFEEKKRTGVTYYLVERSPLARSAARRRLSRHPRIKFAGSLDELEHTSGVEGCVYSNEFFDALPIHRVTVRNGVFRELYVTDEGGRLVESPGDPSTPRLALYLEEQGVALEEGQKAEVCLALEDVVGNISRVLQRGFVFTVDYGEPSGDLFRPERPDGTLRTYEGHRRAADPFEKIGRRDLTAHVDFGRLAVLGAREGLFPLVFASQGSYFLHSAEEVLRRAVENGGPAGAGRVQQLVHPDAFGGAFRVFVQGKNVGRPRLLGGNADKVERLLRP